MRREREKKMKKIRALGGDKENGNSDSSRKKETQEKGLMVNLQIKIRFVLDG
jgi:hypothetical protein